MEVKNIGHQDSVTMGTYDIEEIEKSNENKVEIIWKQSQQIEKLKDKLQKQSEWIENNKNKAKICAIQMNNQAKEITRLKQSSKDLMAVIWKTKRERANKCREFCKVNNKVVQYKKRIAELEEQLKNAIRFKTPQVERFAVVQYLHWEKKPYKIVNCFDAYKDENMKTIYCFYGVPSTNFKVIQICNTEEEAQAKLKELGENK